MHGSVPHGSVLVDGLTVGQVNSVVLRDRRALAADGLLIAVGGGRAQHRASDRHAGDNRPRPAARDRRLLIGAQERVMRVLQRLRRGEVEYQAAGRSDQGEYRHLCASADRPAADGAAGDHRGVAVAPER